MAWGKPQTHTVNLFSATQQGRQHSNAGQGWPEWEKQKKKIADGLTEMVTWTVTV